MFSHCSESVNALFSTFHYKKGVRKIERFYLEKVPDKVLAIYLDKVYLRGELTGTNMKKLSKFISEIKGEIGGSSCFFDYKTRPNALCGKVFEDENLKYAVKFNTYNISFDPYIITIEFNPSKMKERDLLILKKSILPLFQNVEIARIDIAFDINFDLLNCYKMFPGKRSFSRYVSDKKTTSQNFGKKKGKGNYIAIYNKKKQDSDFVRKKYGFQEVVQRLEFRYKSVSTCNNILKNNLDIFKGAEIFHYTGYKFQSGKYKRKQQITNLEKFQIEAIADNPALIKLLDKQGKKEYEKLINSLEKIDLIPLFQSALDTKKAAIKDELESYLIS